MSPNLGIAIHDMIRNTVCTRSYYRGAPRIGGMEDLHADNKPTEQKHVRIDKDSIFP